MTADKPPTGSAWDAREYFPAHINFRIARVLDAPVYNTDFRDIIEALTDLHDLVRAWYDEEINTAVEAGLDEIDELIFKPVSSDRDRKQNKNAAAKKIRAVLFMIMKEIKKQGLLLPDKTYYDEIEGFRKQYE